MATTSAAVTGMKNSAPSRSANGKATIRPIAGNQRQRRKQPIALGGDDLGEHPRLSAGLVDLLMLPGPRVHEASIMPPDAAASNWEAGSRTSILLNDAVAR